MPPVPLFDEKPPSQNAATPHADEGSTPADDRDKAVESAEQFSPQKYVTGYSHDLERLSVDSTDTRTTARTSPDDGLSSRPSASTSPSIVPPEADDRQGNASKETSALPGATVRSRSKEDFVGQRAGRLSPPSPRPSARQLPLPDRNSPGSSGSPRSPESSGAVPGERPQSPPRPGSPLPSSPAYTPPRTLARHPQPAIQAYVARHKGPESKPAAEKG